MSMQGVQMWFLMLSFIKITVSVGTSAGSIRGLGRLTIPEDYEEQIGSLV